MLLPALLLLLAPPAPPGVSAAVQDPAVETVDPHEAVERLREAFKNGTADDILLELEELGRIPDRHLVQTVARAIRHKDPVVREGALEALRFNPHPEALKSLLKVARERKLLEDPEFAKAWYLALGQKGDPKGIKPLADGLRVSKNVVERDVAKTRVLALGRIRDRSSVEVLMGLLTQGAGRRGNHPYLGEIRVAMFVLTGEDRGGRMLDWIQWWNDNKKTVKVLPREPEIPDKGIRKRWAEMWKDPLAEEEEPGDEDEAGKAVDGALGHLGGASGDGGRP